MSEVAGTSGLADADEDASPLVRAFTASRRALGRIARGFVKPHDIEDIVQETFLRTFEASIHTKIHHPRSFMEATARNIAVNFASLHDNRPKDAIDDTEAPAVPLIADSPEPGDCVDAQARFLLFCRAVRRLPLQCQRAFLLKKVYGMRREEIARYLGIAECTVQKHIAKGMVMVSEYMESMQVPDDEAARSTRAGTRSRQ